MYKSINNNMGNLDNIINKITNTLSGDIQLILMRDPKLDILKHIVVDYFVNDKGLDRSVIEAHVSSIQCVDSLELYIQQHYSTEDLLSIYKRAFMNG